MQVEAEKITLREFLAEKLGKEIVDRVLDRTAKRTNPSTIDEFTIVTFSEVETETLHHFIREYYGVLGIASSSNGRLLWVTLNTGEMLIVVILNHSNTLNGALEFDGPANRGGICIEVIQQDLAKPKSVPIERRHA